MVSEHVYAFNQRENAADTAYCYVSCPASYDQDRNKAILREGNSLNSFTFLLEYFISLLSLLDYCDFLSYSLWHKLNKLNLLIIYFIHSLIYPFIHLLTIAHTYLLLQIYNIPVVNVATQLFLGKWGRLYGKKKIISYKKRNYKKSIVAFDPNGVVGQVSKRLGYKGVGRLPTK